MASDSNRGHNKMAEEWLEDENLMLLECWSRDGYTFQDIATRIGISHYTLSKWRREHPEIDKALKQGRELVDYKVESALLKSALGYKTKEVKVITQYRNGQVVDVMTENVEKDQAPNVYAIQTWLYNRLPEKWKKNRDQVLTLGDEDTRLEIKVTRAGSNPSEEDGTVVNSGVQIRMKSDEEMEAEREEREARRNSGEHEESDSGVLNAWDDEDDWDEP